MLPMMMFNSLRRLTSPSYPPKPAVDYPPKGEISTCFASNQRSCWAVLHPNAPKAPDRCGLGPGNSLNGGDFTSPSLCGYFHAPFLTGKRWGTAINLWYIIARTLGWMQYSPSEASLRGNSCLKHLAACIFDKSSHFCVPCFILKPL